MVVLGWPKPSKDSLPGRYRKSGAVCPHEQSGLPTYRHREQDLHPTADAEGSCRHGHCCVRRGPISDHQSKPWLVAEMNVGGLLLQDCLGTVFFK